MPVITKSVPAKNHICVWTFPEGSTPAVRVFVEERKIRADNLIRIAAKTLGVFECNLQFFGLFKGIERPIRKYCGNEMIYLPCKDIISMQKWSFDVSKEKKLLKTDAGANRLFALQCKADIKAGRIKPKPEDIPVLQEYMNPEFPCEKQFVEKCQTLYGYASVHFTNCTVQNDLSVKELKLSEGSSLTVITFSKGMIFKTEQVVFFAPWRKIRRWSQEQGNSVHFEVFFTDEMRFEWIEVETEQSSHLMAAIAEFVYLMKREQEEPTFKLPKWLRNKSEKRLTWKMIKNELFSPKKEDEEDEDEDEEEKIQQEELIHRFDNLYDEASSDESSGEGELEGKASSSSKGAASYQANSLELSLQK